MSEINLKGKRFVVVLRCSEPTQARSSIPQQRTACEKWLHDNGVEAIEWIVLEGYSATLGEQLDTLLDIFQRREAGEEFDGILLDSWNRFVRSEEDAATLFLRSIQTEVLVATAKDGLMAGEGSSFKRVCATEQSVGYVRDLSRNVNRAVDKLVEDGLITPSKGFPFGIDRIYFDEHGISQFRVRRLQDGSRVVMDVDEPHTVRYTIPASQRRLHLRQENWRFELCLGDPIAVQVVRDIFENHYLKGRRPYWIAREFNNRRIPSPRNKMWGASTIVEILTNPVYIGLSVGRVRSKGVHSELAAGSPNMHPTPRRPRTKKNGKGRRKTVEVIYRIPKVWKAVEQPKLEGFLAPAVRESALLEWNRKKEEGWKKPSKPKRRTGLFRVNSSYFLSGLITIKSDGTPMKGSVSGLNSRCYRTHRSQQNPSDSNNAERLTASIPEDAFKEGIKDVLTTFEPIASRVLHHVRELQEEILAMNLKTDPLLREKEDLEKRFKNMFQVDWERGREILQDEMDKTQIRLEQIDRALSEQKCISKLTDKDVTDIVTSVERQFLELSQTSDVRTNEEMRRLAEVFVSHMTFDPDSRTLEMELALPLSAIQCKDFITAYVGTDKRLDVQFFEYTHKEIPLLNVEILLDEAKRYKRTKVVAKKVSRLAA